MERRTFFSHAFKLALGLGLGWPFSGRGQSIYSERILSLPERPSFFFAQVKYGNTLDWNPYPTAARSFMEILIRRTSIPASTDRVDLTLADPKIFLYPFLYLTGVGEFEPFSNPAIENIQRFLNYGGFMLVDDALALPGGGFEESVQREVSRIFPGKTMSRLPEDHTVYQSYYLIDWVVGRKAVRPYLLGMDQEDRTVLIYCPNDLGGAWARDSFGTWINHVDPGSQRQREMAIRLGINIILYALTVNYKKDLIHVPFISERRRRRP
jgi:hypothetical protein